MALDVLQKMKFIPLLIFTTILICKTSADTEEPEQTFQLIVGEKRINVTAGRDVILKGDFHNPNIRLVPSNVRLFNYGGVSFKYPSNFSFEADLSTEGAKLWSLDGNDFIIMIQKYAEEITVKDIIPDLKAMYGKDMKSTTVTHKLGGKRYSGIRITAEVATIKLIQDFIKLPCKDGSIIMMLQDFPIEEKVSDVESKRVLELLNTSFKLDKQDVAPTP